MQVEVILVACCPSKGPAFLAVPTGRQKYELPATYVEESTSTLSTANFLLKYYLNTEARCFGRGWVDLTLAPLADAPDRKADGDRLLSIPYGCLFPDTVPADMGARWVSVGEVFGKNLKGDHADILLGTLQRLSR